MSASRNKRKKKRGRKNASDDDAAYRPGKSQRNAAARPGAVLAMRTDRREEVEPGEPLKVSFMLDMDQIHFANDVSTPVFAGRFARNLEEKAYRPVYQVTEYSQDGSPIEIITPDNFSRLRRDGNYGSLTILSNREQSSQSFQRAFSRLEEEKVVHEVPTEPQELEITKKQQALVTKEKRKNNHRRKTSQRDALGTSAKNHTQDFIHDLQTKMLKLNPEEKGKSLSLSIDHLEIDSLQIVMEILHKINYASIGEAGQVKENLFVGTAEANTAMHLSEQTLDIIKQHYPDGFKLQVNVSHIADSKQQSRSHIGKRIEFTISTKDFTKTDVFHALDMQKPHISFKQFFDALVQSLIPDLEPANKKVSEVNANNFFHKQKKRGPLAEIEINEETKATTPIKRRK